MRDPIVEQVHRTRERIWEECGRDFRKLMERCTETAQRLAPGRLVSLEEVLRRREKAATRDRSESGR